MTYRGKVRNGVVEFEVGNNLPEGTLVHVQPVTVPGDEGSDHASVPGFFTWGRRAVHTGQADLATNLDHHLYGHPKVSDGER